MPILNAVTVGNAYPAQEGSGASLAQVWNAKGGWFSVASAGAFVKLQYGTLGQNHWTDEILLGAGAFVVVPPNCIGMQFRNSVANAIATVTAQIAQGDEPPLAISSIGQTNVVSVASLNFQHGGVAVGTEPTLNFIDGTNSLTWNVADNGAQTRVDLTPAFAPAGLFSTSVTAGAAVQTGVVGNAQGASIFSSGLHQALQSVSTNNVFAAGVVGDTTFRFILNAAGQLNWGPGNAAIDTNLARSGAVPPSSGQVGVSSNQAFYSTNTTGGFIYAAAANNSAFLSFLTAADANPAFKIFTQGAMTWGPGGASAADLELARVSNSPTGTGTFLELLLGAGLGYGTGTGGTGTVSAGAVTVNKPTGQITGTAVTSGSTLFVVVTCAPCGADDVVIVNGQNLAASTIFSGPFVTKVAAGTFSFQWTNNSAGTITPVFNFALIKGAVA